MAKRLFDIVGAAVGLLLSLPLIVVAAVGIRLSSPGPVIYCSIRAGRGGVPFSIFKLRTMHVGTRGQGSRITAARDNRVFTWGAILRKSKLDELPQLWNVLRGDMSLVGPRPEDIEIVSAFYGPLGHESLTVRPGLAGVSSIYNYTHGERMLGQWGGDAETAYVQRLLPIKLALEAIYIRQGRVGDDLRLLIRTATALASILMGRTQFPDPPEMPAAKQLLAVQSQRQAA